MNALRSLMLEYLGVITNNTINVIKECFEIFKYLT